MDTPISVLQEFCGRHLNGVCPEYQLMSVEGVVHAPTFMYRVQIGDTVASASGQSKKKAKHAVALAALENLSNKYNDATGKEYVQAHSGEMNKSDAQPSKERNTDTSEDAGDGEGNPVGKLQEICMKKRWRPPTYDTTEEIGLPHERVFTMICGIDHADVKIRVRGTGRSKKLAKRSAAQEMVLKLESMNIFHSTGMSKSQEKYHDRSQFSANIIPYETGSVTVREKIDSFYKSFGEDLNRELDAFLPDGNLRQIEDPCENLNNVAVHIECVVDYTFMDANSNATDSFICLASLVPTDTYSAPSPVITGWGRGPSQEDAKTQAARKTLLLFKTNRHID